MMKNTFGNNLTITLFGESHGAAIGFTLDGLTPGLPVEEAVIAQHLSRRRPALAADTERREPDRFQIISGVFEGKTTGTPLTLLIYNEDVRSDAYVRGLARPSHADYAAFCKYHGFEDYRGGGHFSGRLTVALVAAGAILLPALERLGIYIGSHIVQVGSVTGKSFAKLCRDKGEASECQIRMQALLRQAKEARFPVIDRDLREQMLQEIQAAKDAKDSVGGKTETAITGLPAGLGEPFFDSAESTLSHILFSIGGIKGVEFGAGFAFAGAWGSAYNDALRMTEDGQVITASNYNGGINGGITNGMPVVFSCAVKPTPSIAKPQETVDFITRENKETVLQGRHDAAIVSRICPVIDAAAALAIADLLLGRYGTDCLLPETSFRNRQVQG